MSEPKRKLELRHLWPHSRFRVPLTQEIGCVERFTPGAAIVTFDERRNASGETIPVRRHVPIALGTEVERI